MSDETQVRVSDLYTTDPLKRNAAIERLVAVGEPAIQPLIRFLKEYETKDHIIYLGDSFWPSIKKVTVLDAVQHALQGIGAPAVPPLIALLQDKDAKLREHAARTLNLIGLPAVAPLIDLLKHGNEATQLAAMAALAGTKDESVVSGLCESLKSGSAKVGVAAVNALIGADDKQRLSALRKALANESIKVRVAAASALTGIRDEQVIKALRDALNDKSVEVRAAVAGALAETEDEQAIIALRQALVNAVSENRRLRRRAIAVIICLYLAVLSIALVVTGIFHWKHGWYSQIFIRMTWQVLIGFFAFDATASVRKNTVTALDTMKCLHRTQM
jgi:HEAT repeat protein